MSESLRLGLTSHVPELILLATALLVVLFDALTPGKGKKSLSGFALLGVMIALAWGIMQSRTLIFADSGTLVFGGMAASDAVASIGKLIILFTLMLGMFFGYRQMMSHNFKGEFYALILFAGFGSIVMANASSLVTLVLGLEIMSLPLYTLAAFDYRKRSSREAGLKYLILGALSSAFLALGCALYYSGTGTLGIHGVTVPFEGHLLYTIGCALILSGLMFKGGILPFFAWSPDVYQGAPDFTVGMMAALAKLGTFLVLIRIMPEIIPGIAPSGIPSGLVLAAAGTMLAGNLLALVQTNVKRLLAFSSVAHAGYMFLGLLALRADSTTGVLFYLATYAPVLVATFHIVAFFPGKDGGHEIAEYTGVGEKSPWIAFIFSVCLLSLAGLPPTAGFIAKAVMFLGVVQGNLVNMVVFAMLVSVIGVYYYLRVIVYMYMREPREDTPKAKPETKEAGILGQIAFAVVGLIVLALGVQPAFFLYLATMAVNQMQNLPHPPGMR